MRLASQKWDGSFHRAAERIPLGSDDLGAWFGSRPGHEVWWSNGERHVVDDWSVMCVATSEWWRATWYARDGEPVQVYVDIGRMLTNDPRDGFVDLDLDVEGPALGPYEVLDRDELAENSRRYGYPPDVVDRIERTAADVVEALENGVGAIGAERLRAWRAGELTASVS